MKEHTPIHQESRNRENLERDIRAALQQIPADADLEISASRRDEILERAWSELTSSRRQLGSGLNNQNGPSFQRGRWVPIMGTTVTAAIVLAIFLQMKLQPRNGATDSSGETTALSGPRHYQTGDVNHDGVVDIADALMISNKLKLQNQELAMDVNGDSEFDQSDLEWTLARIVQIDG